MGVAAVVREVAGGIATARRNREDLNQDKMYLNTNKDSKGISKISIIKSAEGSSEIPSLSLELKLHTWSTCTRWHTCSG